MSAGAAGPVASGIHLYWIPLGAGGSGFVRLVGRTYEAVTSRLQRRRPLDLYHAALEVVVPEGRFAVENAWPSPDANTAARGVVGEGPVLSRWLARFRPFRYEVRCWRNGVIPDAGHAVESPIHLRADTGQAQCLLDLVADVPRLTWARDETGTGEMWNSNSVISWLLVRSGVEVATLRPPAGGRLPGWATGIALAEHDMAGEERRR